MAEQEPRKPARDEEDFHAEEVLDKPFDRRLARRLLAYAMPYRGSLILALGLILTGIALAMVGPILVREVIDGPLNPSADYEASAFFVWLGRLFGFDYVDWVNGPGDDPGALYRWLYLIVGVYAVAVAAQLVLRYAQTVVMSRMGQNVMRDLRLEVFSHLQRQSVAYYHRNPVGRMVTRVTSDVEALNELFTSGVVTLIGDVLALVGIVCVMFYFNAQLAVIAMSVAPFLFGITMLFRHMSRKHYREIRRRLAHLNAFTQESVTGMEIIQISQREDDRAAGYERINEGYLTSFLKSIFWYAVFFPSVELLSAISLALVLYYSEVNIAAGTLSFGDFFLFWSCLIKFFEPVRDLAEKYNILQAAMASSERVFGVLDDESQIPRAETPAEAKPFAGSIRFENVGFSYDEEKTVLRNVDFAVNRGETVALVGATGAGKSTVVNLLLRFYDPTAGRITIDGVDIREFSLEEHRKRFGLVLQDVSVFTRNIRENIDLDRGIDDARITEAARQVNAASFIEAQSQGLDQRMKERGSSLSSGERQLLSFARALAGEPPILVLDEATSHIDSETEALIQDALENLVEGRTSVIIAHRLSTIRSADRILVFHHGELREQGRHEELLARDGIYARLYRLQFP